MQLIRLYPLLFIFLLSAAPADTSVGWGEWVMSWFTAWFEPAAPEVAVASTLVTAPAPPEAAPDAEVLDRLSVIPSSDTLSVSGGWPLLSADPSADVDRRARLLRQSEVVANPKNRLPLLSAPAVRILYPEGQRPEQFIRMARRYADVQALAFSHRLAPALAASQTLPTLVVATDPLGQDVPDPWYRALYTIGDYTLVHFGEAEAVQNLPGGWGFINCPLRAKESETFIAQAVFGAETVGTVTAVRPGFREPETVGIDRAEFEKLDQTINRAIRGYATPGAQLTVLKDGAVIYEQAYGNHRYHRNEPVQVSDLYDLASVTKAAATTLAVMKLYDEGKIDLKARVSQYLPEYRDAVPGRYTIDQLLTHQTGMQSSLPLYPYLQPGYLADSRAGNHSIPLSATRYLDGSVPSRLRRDLAKVEYTRRPVYRYSDINYVVLQYVVEAITGRELNEYVTENFYRPLGLHHLAFRPLDSHPDGQLVPTIVDSWLGRGEVNGYVHDEGAALLGGVAGHAGLFGNATDLGRLFQMLLDGGSIGDRQIISPETVELFTSRGPYNKRALGFDRLDANYHSVVKAGASERTFGHTGFTGTCVWADPDNDLIFVLLTNRTYPDPGNERLTKLGTRSRMHRDLYRALGTFTDPSGV